ncbi:MAG: protein-glutamate O-methyltransferase CheR [Clostridia bacterium]|nr:protein-glutamate O-methyltransferase CheR [Clostridia bacterium]
MIRLTDREFSDITGYVKTQYGINLTNKRELIEARLFSVLSEKGIANFTDYLALVKRNGGEEVSLMLNKLTTNHTYFLREPEHFEFLRNTLLPAQERTNRQRDLRIWSAGCSSGEEAYTAVMVIMDYFGLRQTDWDYRILATDISAKAMEAGRNGVYIKESLKNIPSAWEKKYFSLKGEETYALSEEVKRQVIFRRLNLMEKFPFIQPFDLIFCRNVMIYFDQPTRNLLIEKFYDALKPGGYLFIGHSETIQRNSSRFLFVAPSIYQKG